MEEEAGVNVALVGSERWVVQAPVREIVGGGVVVPDLGMSVEGDLHPVPLSLKVAVHRRATLAGVGVGRYQYSHQKGKQGDDD